MLNLNERFYYRLNISHNEYCHNCRHFIEDKLESSFDNPFLQEIDTRYFQSFGEVSNDKKQIIKATQKGKNLINIAPNSLVAIDLAALWFEQQKMIENNEITRSQFLESVLKQIEYEIQKIQTNNNFTILSDEKINMAYKALKLKKI